MRSCGIGDWFSAILKPRTDGATSDRDLGSGNGGGLVWRTRKIGDWSPIIAKAPPPPPRAPPVPAESLAPELESLPALVSALAPAFVSEAGGVEVPGVLGVVSGRRGSVALGGVEGSISGRGVP